MAATLKHLTQRALADYRFASCDHPLIVAYSDYAHAKSHALPCRDEKARLKRELALEARVTVVMTAAWDAGESECAA